MIIHPNFASRRVRLRLSNRFGKEPVSFSSVSLARRASGAAIVPGSARKLRFEGRGSVTIAPPARSFEATPSRFAYDAATTSRSASRWQAIPEI